MTGFNDNHEPVPITGFSYPDEPDTVEADLTMARYETIYRMLQALTYKANAKQVARKVMFMAALCGLPKRRSGRELAKATGRTEGAVSQGLKQARAIFKHLGHDWRDLPQPETKVSGILHP